MTPILERCLELRALRKAAESTAGGRGQIVHIAGVAGIGKSRLIAEFLDNLPPGVTAAKGNCQLFEAPRPLGALFDMSNAFGEPFRTAIESAVLQPDIFAPVVAAIQRIRPAAVLVFEDAHLADTGTLDLLRFLCQRIAEIAAMVVISYRCDEVSPDHPLTAVLGSCPSRFTACHTINPLSESATDELARHLKAPGEGAFQRTGGNPFLALNCLREISGDKNAIPQAVVQWSSARFAQAQPEEREWLRILAVHPEPVDQALLGRLANATGHPKRALPGWSGFLIEAEDGAIRFRHEIVREALLSTIPAAERRRAHTIWANVLCSDEAFSRDHSAMVLYHALRAGMKQRAVEFACVASSRAEMRGDYVGSARLLEMALPSAEQISPESYAELFEKWVCRASVSDNASEDVLAQVLQSNAHWQRLKQLAPLARNHLLLCRLHRYRAERELARAHLTIAIELLEDTPDCLDDLALAFCLRGQMELEERKHQGAAASARSALKAARQANNHALRLDALVTLAIARQRSRSSSDYTLLAGLEKLAELANLHEMAARINAALFDEAEANMDLPAAEMFVAGWAWSKGKAPNCWKAALDGREALGLVLHGQLEQARTLASGQIESGRIIRSMQFPARLALALSLSRCQDQAAPEALAEAHSAAVASGDPRNIALARLAMIENAFLEGRIHDALALCNADAAACSGSDTLDTRAMMDIWRERLEWIAGAAVDDRQGVEAGNPPVHSDSRQSISELAALGYAFKAALAKLFVDGPDAPSLIGEAVADFTAQSAKAGLNCAYRVAKARGIVLAEAKRERGPYRATRSNSLGLTRREVEILRMMVEGAGNREIAEHFGRSLRTVEHHVSAILGKMGLDSRIQAVLFAIAHPDVLGLTELESVGADKAIV